MTRSIRTAAGAAVGAVIAALVVVLPAPLAHAATTYTWTQGYDGAGDPVPGADHVSWSDPDNWSPSGVPGAGDSVLLTSAHGYDGTHRTTTLTVPAHTSLTDLTISEVPDATVYLQGEPLTVTGSFDWTGGRIHTPVTIAGSGRVGPGTATYLGTSDAVRYGMLDVTGTLLLDGIGAGDGARLTVAPDPGGDLDGIRVAKGAVLRARGTNLVAGTGCCVDPANIVVGGRLDVTGRTTFHDVELDLRGTTKVARGATLASTGGPARLGANARYAGGGTVDFTDTASIAAHPDKEPVPGGNLMRGTGLLSDQTRIHFGTGAILSGVGGFAGRGIVDVSSPANGANRSAAIVGDLTIGAGTSLRLGGKVPSRTSVFNETLRGYHPVLRIKGAAILGRGSRFTTGAGTLTTVMKGGRLDLAPGSVWGEGACCVAPARLTVAGGGTLALIGGSGAMARVTRTDLRLQGTLSLAAGKRLVAQGHPARVGGTLKVIGRTAPGKNRSVLTAPKITGTFGCVQPSGQVAVSGPRAVTITGIQGKTAACVSATGKKLATKTLKPHKTVKITVVNGVAKAAKKVVLAVTVTKVRKAARIKVGGASAFRAPKGKVTTRYLVATRAKKKFVTVKNIGKSAVKVKVVLLRQ
ncbi:MAG TPA: hypothetical protein VF426_02870 [Marmoricola sp.]